MSDYVPPFSWRIKEPGLLGKSVNQKTSNCCWAVALTRQLEAVLRLSGRLGPDEHLSIQETISVVVQAHNKDPSEHILNPAGGLQWIHKALDALVKYGTVLKKSGPSLTFSIAPRDLTRGHKKFKPGGYKVLYNDLFKDQHGAAGPSVFEDAVKRHLQKAPLMASFTYVPTADLDPIYNPSAADVKAARYCHSVLLTGHDIDEDGTPYWEYQDSYGMSTGSKGFRKLACGKELIGYVVVMTPADKKASPKKRKRAS